MNKMRLPWKVWDLHVIDCDGNGVAFNVGATRAKLIVNRVNYTFLKQQAEEKTREGKRCGYKECWRDDGTHSAACEARFYKAR